MVMKHSLAASVALLMLVGLQPVLAQVIPGGHPGDRAVQNHMHQMQHRAEIVQQLNQLLSDWRVAWSDDQLEEILELYTEDAVISPPGTSATALGRDEVASALTRLLADAGGMETRLTDLDIGDRLAYTMGWFSYPVIATDGVRAGGSVRGRFVTVFRQSNDRWRIRSQLFEITEDDSSSA